MTRGLVLRLEGSRNTLKPIDTMRDLLEVNTSESLETLLAFHLSPAVCLRPKNLDIRHTHARPQTQSNKQRRSRLLTMLSGSFVRKFENRQPLANRNLSNFLPSEALKKEKVAQLRHHSNDRQTEQHPHTPCHPHPSPCLCGMCRRKHWTSPYQERGNEMPSLSCFFGASAAWQKGQRRKTRLHLSACLSIKNQRLSSARVYAVSVRRLNDQNL